MAGRVAATLERIDRVLAPEGLAIVGAFHPLPEDAAPPGTQTLCLIGARGDAMWRAFRTAPEATDAGPDPLDRWSTRVISAAAVELGAEARFPFGGPPHEPFLRWAARGEGTRPSPVAMPVSPSRGLWASYRGALAFTEALALEPAIATDPCLDCPAPCLSACPVDAFAGGRYDVAACLAHLTGPGQTDCGDGCRVRLACPVGSTPPRAQRRFHMRAFVAAQQDGD